MEHELLLELNNISKTPASGTKSKPSFKNLNMFIPAPSQFRERNHGLIKRTMLTEEQVASPYQLNQINSPFAATK